MTRDERQIISIHIYSILSRGKLNTGEGNSPEDPESSTRGQSGLAEEQYATFRVQQDQPFECDFEREIKRIERGTA